MHSAAMVDASGAGPLRAVRWRSRLRQGGHGDQHRAEQREGNKDPERSAEPEVFCKQLQTCSGDKCVGDPREFPTPVHDTHSEEGEGNAGQQRGAERAAPCWTDRQSKRQRSTGELGEDGGRQQRLRTAHATPTQEPHRRAAKARTSQGGGVGRVGKLRKRRASLD